MRSSKHHGLTTGPTDALPLIFGGCAQFNEALLCLMPLDPEAELGAKNSSGLSDMLAAVEKSAPAALATALVEFNHHSRHALNSFVHTGIHPLARTRAGFPPELAEAVVRLSASVSHFAYRLLAALSGSQERTARVTRAYMGFTDCLPMTSAAGEMPC